MPISPGCFVTDPGSQFQLSRREEQACGASFFYPFLYIYNLTLHLNEYSSNSKDVRLLTLAHRACPAFLPGKGNQKYTGKKKNPQQISSCLLGTNQYSTAKST